MARAKLLLRGDQDYLIVTHHDKGHFSIQEFYGKHPRPPIVMNAKKAYALAEWLTTQAGSESGDKATYDPAAEKAGERKAKRRR